MRFLAVLVSTAVVTAMTMISLTAPGSASVPTPDEDGSYPFEATLAAGGFFEDVAAHRLARGFVPYEVNAEPWADGAKKVRFIRLPRGRTIRFDAKKPLVFPEGTILLQTLRLERPELGMRRLETRVIVVGPKKKLSFATYVWNDEQTAATLRTRGREFYVKTDDGILLWKVIATKQCTKCHTGEEAVLGFTTIELNKLIDAAEKTSDKTPPRRRQLHRLAEKNVLSAVPKDLSKVPALVDPHDGSGSLDRRTRSYLHINCATCHRPDGNGSARIDMDMRYTVPLDKTGMGPQREVLLKGDPFSSWVYLRLIYTDRRHMPSVLTHHVDERGADLIHDWVKSMDASPNKN